MDLSCRPLPWTLVTAGALLTNKKYDTFNNPNTHYEMTKEWFDVWSKWCEHETATFVTYNGLFFDEEIIRRQFYWNLINPLYNQYQRQCPTGFITKNVCTWEIL